MNPAVILGGTRTDEKQTAGKKKKKKGGGGKEKNHTNSIKQKEREKEKKERRKRTFSRGYQSKTELNDNKGVRKRSNSWNRGKPISDYSVLPSPFHRVIAPWRNNRFLAKL